LLPDGRQLDATPRSLCYNFFKKRINDPTLRFVKMRAEIISVTWVPSLSPNQMKKLGKFLLEILPIYGHFIAPDFLAFAVQVETTCELPEVLISVNFKLHVG
jgi:hypothetical protein